jgi:glutamyl-tRNA reductase
VHYDDGAVSHLFHVAAGLDSMVLGESQILGQTREALRIGQECATIGPSLNALFQQALRVGKRSHAETDIDRVAPSLVSAALDRAAAHVGDLAGKDVVVVGAGSMAGLAVATAHRAGAASIVVANRTPERAAHLASEYAATAVPLSRLAEATGPVDVLISCTGAAGVLIHPEDVVSRRTNQGPLAVIDLALPHDVDPAVGELPGVHLIALSTLAAELEHTPGAGDVEGVRTIVAQELAAFLAARRSRSVTPTVVALRTMATGVVDAELERLLTRLPGLDGVSRVEVEKTIRRVAEKLLHQPTVRVKELANETGAISYAAALAELFALDPDAVEAVTRAEVERS